MRRLRLFNGNAFSPTPNSTVIETQPNPNRNLNPHTLCSFDIPPLPHSFTMYSCLLYLLFCCFFYTESIFVFAFWTSHAHTYAQLLSYTCLSFTFSCVFLFLSFFYIIIIRFAVERKNHDDFHFYLRPVAVDVNVAALLCCLSRPAGRHAIHRYTCLRVPACLLCLCVCVSCYATTATIIMIIHNEV